jgi:valyl-tRNA synthetase
MRLPKQYEPQEYEDNIYALWEDSNAFQADPDSNKPRYSISMPPPNATGKLHVGHALGTTIQDTLVRYARMNGKDVLWLPGTDHAALATNAIMEKQLAEEGTNKHEIGREEFINRLQLFIEESRDNIRNQIRKMGASCDWSRERYTLEPTLNRCVNEMFVKMYNDGVVYRGHRIVNWDPKSETTISDDEIVWVEEKAIFYNFKYGPFEISTARPETKFGDKYVVVHPDDKRYTKYKHGETFKAEWINGPVTATVIKDKAVDPKFGTGAMTITPWHDRTDFEIAERHKLDKEQIIDFQGKLLPIAGEFSGMEIGKARPLIVEKLDKKGLLVNANDKYVHNIAISSRGGGVIEPQIKLQWFVDVNKKAVKWKGELQSLKEVMQDVVNAKDIAIVPERFEKVYFYWIDNLRDWCVSRQIWWGHRVPAWYRTVNDQEEIYVGLNPPPDDGSQGWHLWEQDPDTLDTWFSSALWTWSTLIDDKLAADYSLPLDKILASSRDYQTYHPTTVLETAWDILFFWVARMILATTYMTGEIPFKTVYLHGLVRGEFGEKMSKSKPETMIDPLEVIPKYGTDALRLALIHGNRPGNDQRMSVSRITAQRNFCNKLWNIARYIEGSSEKAGKRSNGPITLADHWILEKSAETIKQVSGSLDKFQFGEAFENLYHYIWDDFADWYIEACKSQKSNGLLLEIFETVLKLTHPFAPFVTETIWQTLNNNPGSMLISADWPKPVAYDVKKAKQFNNIKTVVSELRYLKQALNLKDNSTELHYLDAPLISENSDLIERLARVKVKEENQKREGLIVTTSPCLTWLEIEDSAIKKHQRELETKHTEQRQVMERLSARLKNPAYTKSAPPEIVADTENQLKTATRELEDVNNQLQRFKK